MTFFGVYFLDNFDNYYLHQEQPLAIYWIHQNFCNWHLVHLSCCYSMRILIFSLHAGSCCFGESCAVWWIFCQEEVVSECWFLLWPNLPVLRSCIYCWKCDLHSLMDLKDQMVNFQCRAMGFPTEFFPVLFAIPRMAGYLAHWRESLDDPDTKIMRPQQVSIFCIFFPMGCVLSIFY